MICEAYKRWRHTKGYGVHSPFAYKIVKEVIKPKRGYGYYGYSKIEKDLDSDLDGHICKLAYLLLRLAARSDVASAYLGKFALNPGLGEAGNGKRRKKKESPFLIALKAANSKIAVYDDPELLDNARLVITHGNEIDITSLCKLLERQGRIILCINPEEGTRERLFECLEEGLMFYGKRNILIFSRPDMQKVSYSIRI